MFETWKQAWRDAVENFRRELDPERYAAETDRRTAAMRRDLASARARSRQIEKEIAATSLEVTRERDLLARCQHRETLARRIEDHETARIAAEFAARHAERASILQQKLDALTAEHALLQRDLDAMQVTLDELAPGVAADDDESTTTAGTPPGAHAEADQFYDTEFRRLDEEARERAAEARLEELKKKMR